MKSYFFKSVLGTALLLACHFAAGQQPADPPPGRAALEGTVISAQNGRVVPRATVIARGLTRSGDAKSVRADGEGHFIFKSLAPGSYRLSAEHQSFFSGTRHQVFQYRVDVTADEHHGNIVLRLLPAAVVTGQIIDENSDPLKHVHVRLMERVFRNGRMQLNQVEEGFTDDQGRYRIFDVRPGTYYLVAQIEPEIQLRVQQGGGDNSVAQASVQSDIAYPPMFYPDAADFRDAQALPVAPADELQANFIFYSKPSVSISGKVLNGITGDPARSAAVVARWSEYLNDNQSTAKSSVIEGFELRGLTPGLYTLHAVSAEDGVVYTAQRTVEVGPTGLENIVLSTMPDTPVAGSVKVDGSAEERNALRRVAIEFQSNTTPARASVSATLPDLNFQTRLHPGELYTVTARNLPADYYLKSVRIGGHAVEQDQVQVGDESTEIELFLGPEGGHISGLVLDENGQPISTPVVLVPDASRRNLPDLFRKTTSDKKGIFNLRGVPPGTYELLAFDDVDLNELIGQPEILNSFEDRAVTLNVEEQTDYTTALKIIRTTEDATPAP